MGNIRAGNLRHRITIEYEDQTQDPATGEITVTWTKLATVWGEWQDLRGSEYWEAAQAQSEVSARVRIRHRTDIDPSMRVRHGSRTGLIDSMLDPERTRQELHLMVKEIR